MAKASKIIETGQKQRTGLIFKKIGMTSVIFDNGNVVPCTVLEFEPQFVVGVLTAKRNGYNALQLACGKIKKKNVAKPQLGHFAKAKVEPKKISKEFLVSEDALLPIGTQLKIEHFKVGQFVDIVGTAIGKGFAGVMKRWNFRGLEATHGVSITHRSHGSTGQCQDPGKVFKNKKMAGQLGNNKVTIHNLMIVDIDLERSLVLVKGAVPGKKGSYVFAKDAVKKVLGANLPYPASIIENADAESAA
ncbi:50S ribosomal protein L3 [Rickettsiales endosymbiont of Stachyamoeba lipophora]|uniref:50S ribosomal protein L3 n=1 Tax=Rickettsiales endosymbiont of Stachyamoeba lipophora TaxID=2486578 RepID=UPI000F64C331|nr:50S ribosomal protein L3 [Rickettsiales endosymbiont of Stachyamoeba lipophora]AZL15864.1 50S ribosomal protein L3 [Rickettsiales endosymbiont of Stachyamoeba lipophora]